MYKISHIVNVYLVAFFVLLCTNGCKCEKTPDAVSDPGFMAYTFDWKNILPGYPIPGTLRYCFYPSDRGAMIQMDNDNIERMRFALPPDQYKVIIFNCDADAIPVRNIKQFDESEAFLPTVSFKDAVQKANANQMPLYAVIIDTLLITPRLDSEIRVTPQSLAQPVGIKVNIKGMEYIKECKSSLSGVLTAINLSTRKPVPGHSNTVVFETRRTSEGIEGNAMILGIASPTESTDELADLSHQLTLDFTFIDGSTVSSTVDLENQLATIEGETNPVEIEIDALIKRDPSFSVVLNGWKAEWGNIVASTGQKQFHKIKR